MSPYDLAYRLQRRYQNNTQGPSRLATSLKGFFLAEGVSAEDKKRYASHIQSHLRTAVEFLMEQEAIEELSALESLGWFSPTSVDAFIQIAKDRSRTASLIWLLHLKNRRYGFAGKKYTL